MQGKLGRINDMNKEVRIGYLTGIKYPHSLEKRSNVQARL